tara:strand:+ start:510 stop:1262 length:753 start_codon:yes stop_codon:yes gene_type:complete
MRSGYRKKTLVVLSAISLVSFASGGVFHSKDKAHQAALQSKVNDLEKLTNDLSEKIRQLELSVSALQAPRTIGEAGLSGQDQLESVADQDEMDLMSSQLSYKREAGKQMATQDMTSSETESGLYSKITSLIERKDYKKAQTFAQSYMQTFAEEKNAPTVLFWLGEIKMLFGELVDAKAHYQKSLDMLKGKGRTPEILLKIAVISYQKGEVAEGDHYYDQLQKVYPGSTASHMARAQKKKYRRLADEKSSD